MGARYRAIYDGKGLLAEYEGEECVYVREDYIAPNRSDLPSPGLISDQHEPFLSMADGKVYDSKSAYRRTLKAKGLTEVGNDAPVVSHQRPITTSTRREVLHKRLADVSDREANKLLKSLKKEFAR
jgi:hypothetical protein